MCVEEFPSAPPQQPGKRAKQPPPADRQVGVIISFILHIDRIGEKQ